jgi:hypothetical protein
VGLRESFAARRRELLQTPGFERTLTRLDADGVLTREEAASLHAALPELLAESGYVLRHLGAHAAIASVFLLDVIPLPLGTLSRVLWVAGSRAYETLFGTPERARIHSLLVLGIAAIPGLGYAAYLLPLRRQNERAAFLFASHMSYALFDAPSEALVARSPRALRGFARRLLPGPPGARPILAAGTEREPR